MTQYYTLLTPIGLAKVANAQVTQSTVAITQIAVGDGNGSSYAPSGKETTLKNEKWRGAVTSVSVDNSNSNWVVVDAILPGNIGGFILREVGLFDSDGDLIAIGNYPDTYKPVVGDGSIMDLTIRTIIEVNNASSVTLKIDPNVIIASRPYVDGKIKEVMDELNEHNNKDVHLLPGERDKWNTAAGKVQDASTTVKGIVQLNDTLTSTSTTQAATPNALKKVNDKLGDLAALKTADKTNIVVAINELFTNVSDGKTKIAAATTDQGVSTSPDATFDQMAANIRRIQRGRKWAVGSGYVGNSYEYSTGGSSFPFKPEIIILAKIKNGNLMEHAVYVTKNNYFHLNTPYDSNFYTFRDETAPVGHRDQMQYGQVTFEQHSNSWGWTMRISTNAIPANCDVTWIAFGPHEQ